MPSNEWFARKSDAVEEAFRTRRPAGLAMALEELRRAWENRGEISGNAVALLHDAERAAVAGDLERARSTYDDALARQ